MKFFSKPSLPQQIFIALVVGLIIGLWAGPKAQFLGEAGKLLIQLIKIIATPLVFFAIIETLQHSEIRWATALKLLVIVGINATLAALIGLSLSNLFNVGDHLKFLDISQMPTTTNPAFMTQKLEYSKIFTGLIPSNPFQPFIDNNLPSVILMALVLGFSFKKVKSHLPIETTHSFEGLITTVYNILLMALEIIIKLIPLAVLGVMAKTVGEFGLAPLKGLSLYVVVALLGLTLQIVFVYHYWILFVAQKSLREFWTLAKTPISYAFGCNSSLATLPLTLKALDAMKVSKESSRMGACVGTNLNNDGILLYEAMAMLIVAQMAGVQMSLPQQAEALIVCVVAAIGVAGVPEAGIISLSLVLTTMGLPLEALPLLLTVDWIIARARSVTNVMSDMTVSLALDHWKWFSPKTIREVS